MIFILHTHLIILHPTLFLNLPRSSALHPQYHIPLDVCTSMLFPPISKDNYASNICSNFMGGNAFFYF